MTTERTNAAPLELERHLKLSRICELYDVSQSSLRKKIRAGQLVAIRFGGSWRVAESELQKLVK